jgi:hypothetical protein
MSVAPPSFCNFYIIKVSFQIVTFILISVTIWKHNEMQQYSRFAAFRLRERPVNCDIRI